MVQCNACHSSEIRTRTNYSHGAKSKSKKTFNCKICGSNDIQLPQKNTRRRR